MKHAFLPVVALAAFGLMWGSPVTGQAQQQMPQEQQQAPDFSDNELQSYAEAVVKVQQINDEYLPQLQAADTPEQQEAVREEATGKMIEAIQEEGITVEDYNAIFTAARADPQLAERINTYIQQAQ